MPGRKLEIVWGGTRKTKNRLKTRQVAIKMVARGDKAILNSTHMNFIKKKLLKEQEHKRQNASMRLFSI